MKPINKYKPHTIDITVRSTPGTIVPAAWICGLCIALFFWPQIHTYINLQFSAQLDEVEPIEEHIPEFDSNFTLQAYFPQKTIQSKQKQDDLASKNLIPRAPQSYLYATETEQIRTFKKAQKLVPPIEIPQKILIVGSSSMNGALGAFLSKNLRKNDLEIFRHTKVSSGLARPDYYNWMEVLPGVLSKYNPDMVLVHFIGNDCQSLITADGRLDARYGKPEWEEKYRDRIADLIQLIQKNNIQVAFVGMSNVGLPGFRRRLRYANRIIRDVAKSYDSQFISIWEVTSDERGVVLPSTRRGNIDYPLLASDDIHLSVEGSRLVSREIFHQLNSRYKWK